ncbi:MAG: helicase c-terminal, partial [Chthoniobacteraceae bacterium]|nr:helicase c-terminal [Chthoniobacteraceae bacterium]
MAYFVGGAVQDIAQHPGGESFSAEVTGSRSYRTVVVYEPGSNKWVETCSCSTGSQCRHTYALMKSLLVAPVPAAEAASETPDVPPVAPKKQAVSPFTAELEAAHERKLSVSELEYLGAIGQAFAQVKKNGVLQSEDLDSLDLDVPGFARDRVAIWPALPANEREFWLYLVLFLEERSVRIPFFMEPVSDPGPVRDRVEQWKRERDVERWKKLLSHLHDDVPVSPPRELDLRLRFTSGQAIIESRRAGEPEFAPMKPPQFKALANVPDSECTPEAALLCQRLVERAEFGMEPSLRYFEADASGILNEILRVPWLASRLVAENGMPMAHPTEPLRWDLSPVYDESEDYKLRLVLPDGSHAGPFLFVAKG